MSTTKYIVNNVTGQTIYSGITINGNLTLSGNTNIRPYKVYTALLTQEAGNPLSVDVLENTIGEVIWTHPSTGVYIGTLASAFPLAKTALFISNSLWNSSNITYITNGGSGDSITIETYDSSNTSLSDDILGYTTVEIKVYD